MIAIRNKILLILEHNFILKLCKFNQIVLNVYLLSFLKYHLCVNIRQVVV